MKISKTKLAKLLRENGVPVDRTAQKDIGILLNLANENNIDLSSITSKVDTPNGDTPNDDTPNGDTPNGDTPNGDTPNGDTPNGDTPNVDKSLDEEDKLFARMAANRVDEKPNENSSFLTVEDNEPKQKQKRGRKTKAPETGFEIEGYILLMLMDLALPVGISFLLNMFEKNPTKKITAEQIMLTDEQKTKLAPLADKAAEQLKFKMNPITAFVLMSTVSYGFNVFQLKSTMK